MRSISAALGVQCQFCHVGDSSASLAQIDFASDLKRNKIVARHMLRMVQEINGRIDSIPARGRPPVVVTCNTCHRGLSRPIPLTVAIAEAATAVNADSAIHVYRALRERYFGRDAYDFSEVSLSSAAFRVARAGKYDDAFALLRLNEELFPKSSAMYVIRGNIHLMKADTLAAAAAFREAVRLDPTNDEAVGRLRVTGQRP
jgi:tetratricopeptide (TPR) repeat protein